MMRIIFAILIFLHGLIHFMGFANAFGLALVPALSKCASKPWGSAWLVSAMLLIVLAIRIFRQQQAWVIGLAAWSVSQILIILCWRDAKWGSLPNLVLLAWLVVAIAQWHFEGSYRRSVAGHLKGLSADPLPVLTSEMIQHLPKPVQRYMAYSGCLGKPVVKSFKAVFKGEIRESEQSPWMSFTCEQYNFMDQPARLFFMNARMKGLPMAGFHAYVEGKATMDIKLLSLVRVQYQSGPEMDLSETTTFLNDLCLLAPGTLIDRRITWTEIDQNRVKASFKNEDVRVEAILVFSEEGALINFISGDRYYYHSRDGMQRATWSTPVQNYQAFGEYRLSSRGEACWESGDTRFAYGIFKLQQIRYNPKK